MLQDFYGRRIQASLLLVMIIWKCIAPVEYSLDRPFLLGATLKYHLQKKGPLALNIMSNIIYT